jgi:cell division protein ZapA (FtsZ GTPase activity inhibitor)
MNKRLIILIGICVFLVYLVGGCQNTAEKPVPEQNADQTSETQMTASERRVLASKLSQTAEEVEGVRSASVVVSRVGVNDNERPGVNTNDNMRNVQNENALTDDNEMSQVENGIVAMVGLTLDDNIVNDVDKVNSTKQRVQERLRSSDQKISQVLVTTDPNLNKRINDLAAGIIEGKPIQSFEEDINDLSNELRE